MTRRKTEKRHRGAKAVCGAFYHQEGVNTVQMINFFALHPGEACGSFTPGHIGAMAVCAVLIIAGIILTYKKKMDVDRFLLVIGIVCTVFEVAKVLWGIAVHRYTNYANFLPLWFCSLFVPAAVIAGVCKGKMRRLALSFMFYGGIIGGIAYLIFPATSLYKFPLFHFISVHSMLYHSVMIYSGIMIVLKGCFVPSAKDFLPYFAFTTAACVLAYIVNVKFGTNLMFLNRTSNNVILKAVMRLTGRWYPAAVTLGQNIGSFAVSYGIYRVVKGRKRFLRGNKK